MFTDSLENSKAGVVFLAVLTDIATDIKLMHKAQFKDSHIDQVHDIVERYMRAGEWPTLDIIMEYSSATPVEKGEFGDSVLLDYFTTMLTATLPAKSKIPGRKIMYRRAVEKFGKEMFEGLE